jgi:hypothetical protein
MSQVGANVEGRLGGAGVLWSRLVGLTMLMLIGLAACGGGSATTTSTTTTTVTVPLPSAAVSKSDIEQSYTTLFDLSNPAVTPKLGVVQDGSALRAAFTAAIHSALAKEAGGATVLSVKVEQGAACTSEALPSPCAIVVYNIFSPSKAVLLSGSKGSAVWENGHWLVAKTTICSLLTLESAGKTPVGCS